MLAVNRSGHPAPACLSDHRASRGREILFNIFARDRELVSQRAFSMSGFLVEDRELDAALDQLFQGRCAFCESNDRLHPYRFRPTEEAGPSNQAPFEDADRAHLYYTWLANAWENLYPICRACQPYEPSVFPVTGKRRPLPDEDELQRNQEVPTGGWITNLTDNAIFLDPCAGEDFRKHLAFLPDGRVIGIGKRGAMTVRHFQLDRPEVTWRRESAFSHYRDELFDPQGRGAAAVFRFSRMEYGGAWFLLLYQIARRIGGGLSSRPILSLNRIERYYSERLQDPGFRDQFDQAWRDLMGEADLVFDAPKAVKVEIEEDGKRPVGFEIENFKALERVVVRLPDPIDRPGEGASGSTLVILGENAAGKSSLLEAMALALVDHQTRAQLPPKGQDFMLDPRLMGAPEQGAPRRGRVSVRYDGGWSSTMGVEPNFPTLDGGDLVRLPVFAYGAFRLYRGEDTGLRRSDPLRSLFDPAFVLPNPEKWLVSIHERPAFKEVLRVLGFLLGFANGDDVIVVRGGRCYLQSIHRRAGAEPLVQRTPLSVVSSGYRSVLAMACDIMRGLLAQQDSSSPSLMRSRAVVLIDEIEAHLHPRWKMRIVQALRTALPNVTFILTTHDPLCLRGVDAQEVVVFRRVEHATKGGLPVVVEQLEELPDVGALTIEQILTSDLFQLYSTDGPAIEARFARAADLLAADHAGRPMTDDDNGVLAAFRAELADQVRRGMPVGSTEVERLVQEAVEEFIRMRHRTRAKELGELRNTTRNAIVRALGGL